MVTLIAPRRTAGTATTSGSLVRGTHTPVDATAGAITMALPSNAPVGVEISVEKVDASTNAVNVTGTLRGVASSTLSMTTQYEVRTFLSDGNGSWRLTSDLRTKASLDAAYAAQSRSGTKSVGQGELMYSVKDFGAKGDNATDDTAAIQATINAVDTAGGGIVFFPHGVYVTGTLTCKSNISFVGTSYDLQYTARGSRLRLKAGTNGHMFLVPWATCVNVNWRMLHLEGNSANQTGSSNGIHFAYNPANTGPQTYQQSKIDQVSVKGFLGDGVYVGKWNEGVDVLNCFISDNKGHGIHFETSDCAVIGGHIMANGGDGIRLGNGACTVVGCSSIAGNLRGIAIVSGGTDPVEFSQGTYVGGHILSAVHVDINVQEGAFIQGNNNRISGFFAGNSQFGNNLYANIKVDGKLSDGTTSSVGNKLDCVFGKTVSANDNGNKPSFHVLIQNYGTSSNFVDLTGSTFDLSGAVIDAVNDWQVFGTQNRGVQRVGHLVSQSGNNTQGNPLYNATIAAGAGAGTTPPTPSVTNATDVKGQMFCGTGTSPASGPLCAVTFAKPYLLAPSVILTPGNAATAAITGSVYVVPSTTGFVVNVSSTLPASQANGTYQWFYHVIG